MWLWCGDIGLFPPHPTHANKRVSLCVMSAHYVLSSSSHKHWSRISSRICPSPKDKRLGGAETSVWQAQRCRSQATRCTARSLIGPPNWPISGRRGLRKILPRTRAECTQEGETAQICCASKRCHTLDMSGNASLERGSSPRWNGTTFIITPNVDD